MVSSGELYDWAAEARDVKTTPDRLRELCLELIDDLHRLSHLIEEMADFRTTKQHDKVMAEMASIQDKLNAT